MSARDHVQPELFPDSPRTHQPSLQQRAGRVVAQRADVRYDSVNYRRPLWDFEKADLDAADDARQQEKVDHILETSWKPALAHEASQRSPAMRMQSNIIPDVLKEGRIKNQYETGNSQGSFSPRMRLKEESRMFGYSREAPHGGFTGDPDNPGPTSRRETLPNARPVYGYLAMPAAHQEPNQGTAMYGDAIVHMKPEVAERTTVAVGDTLGGNYKAVSVTKARRGDFKGTGLRPEGDHYGVREAKPGQLAADNYYLEAQYHGGLSSRDISHVEFPPHPAGRHQPWVEGDRKVAQLALQNNGVPYHERSASGVDSYTQGTMIRFPDHVRPEAIDPSAPDAGFHSYGSVESAEPDRYISKAWQPGLDKPVERGPLNHADFISRARLSRGMANPDPAWDGVRERYR